jgi:hypothetical protein
MSGYTFVITKKEKNFFEATFNGETKKLNFHKQNRYFTATFRHDLQPLHAYLDIQLKWYGPEYNESSGWKNIVTNHICIYYIDSDYEEFNEENPILRYEKSGFTIEYKDFNKSDGLTVAAYSFKNFWNAWKAHVVANNQDVWEKCDIFKTHEFIVEKSKKKKFEKFMKNYVHLTKDDFDELNNWQPRLMADYKALILKEGLVEDDDDIDDSDEPESESEACTENSSSSSNCV